MKQVTYLVVTFAVLYQLYATTSAAPPPPHPPPRDRPRFAAIDGPDDRDVHSHEHGDEFSVRVYETPGNTFILMKNFLEEMSSFFHLNLNKGNTVVVLEEGVNGLEDQIYTQRVLTLENQHRLQAPSTRDDQTAPEMTTHSPESSSRQPIHIHDEVNNGTSQTR